VFNTHYPAHALQRSSKALILSKGGDYDFGSTASVVTEASIRRAFGVEAVIGDVETPTSILRNVIPLHIAGDGAAEEDADRRAIATVTIIASNNRVSDRINGTLSEYGDMVVGRMGMPYRECGLYLITVTLDGSRTRIRELTQRLGVLPDVSVKTTFAKENAYEL
jgi:iron complex transport system ATP-binding protein